MAPAGVCCSTGCSAAAEQGQAQHERRVRVASIHVVQNGPPGPPVNHHGSSLRWAAQHPAAPPPRRRPLRWAAACMPRRRPLRRAERPAGPSSAAGTPPIADHRAAAKALPSGARRSSAAVVLPPCTARPLAPCSRPRRHGRPPVRRAQLLLPGRLPDLHFGVQRRHGALRRAADRARCVHVPILHRAGHLRRAGPRLPPPPRATARVAARALSTPRCRLTPLPPCPPHCSW